MKIKIFILCSIVFFACKKSENMSRTGQLLKGNHELRKFKITSEEGYRWSASYFIIAGSGSGSNYSDTKASFSWKLNNGEYAISEIELGKIRIKIDSTVCNPYVKFNWQESSISDLEYIFSRKLNYMVITCTEDDYPINIDLTKL